MSSRDGGPAAKRCRSDVEACGDGAHGHNTARPDSSVSSLCPDAVFIDLTEPDVAVEEAVCELEALSPDDGVAGSETAEKVVVTTTTTSAAKATPIDRARPWWCSPCRGPAGAACGVAGHALLDTATANSALRQRIQDMEQALHDAKEDLQRFQDARYGGDGLVLRATCSGWENRCADDGNLIGGKPLALPLSAASTSLTAEQRAQMCRFFEGLTLHLSDPDVTYAASMKCCSHEDTCWYERFPTAAPRESLKRGAVVLVRGCEIQLHLESHNPCGSERVLGFVPKAFLYHLDYPSDHPEGCWKPKYCVFCRNDELKMEFSSVSCE